MSYRGPRGSFSYPTSPGSPRSIHSVGSRNSIRSVRSATWDNVVEAIIGAEPTRDSQYIPEDALPQPHEPAIAEEEDEELSHRQQQEQQQQQEQEQEQQQQQRNQHWSAYYRPQSLQNQPAANAQVSGNDGEGQGHSAHPSMDASTIVNGYATEQGSFRRSSALSVPASARVSRASYTNFDFGNNEGLDMTLQVPELDVTDSRLEEEEQDEVTGDDADEKAEAKAEPNEKNISYDHHTSASRASSRSATHSAASTVLEHLDEAATSKEDAAPNENVDVEAGAFHEEQQQETRNETPFSAFPTRSKQLIVLGAASASVFAPLSMQIYLPSLTELVSDFDVSRSAINLTVSVYMIFMAISPMLIGGLADVVGRRPAMLACFAIYMVSCIMIALCRDYKELMGFRILQSIGASPTIAIASAVVADIVTSAERGSYAALVALPVIFAPTLGPVIGGLLTQYLGWRSIFWFLLIAGAFTFVMMGLFFPETCRYIVGDASAKPPKRYRSVAQMVGMDQKARPEWTQSAADEKARFRGQHSVKRTMYLSLTAAVRVLLTRERFCLLFYVGLVFAGFQAIATELPTQFKAIYGYDSVMIGIMYLPLAGGAMISTAVFGKQMNRNFRKYVARAGINLEAGQEVDMNKVNVERARLEITIAPLLISTAGIICWGWVLEKKTSIAAPCVLLFFMGVGLNGVMATTNALLMDISQAQAGAVMAASNLTRCALGAVASAAIQTMIDKLGLGWTYVVFGIIFFAFSPMIALHFYRGHHLRKQAKAREDRKSEKVPPEAAIVQIAAVDAVVNVTTAIPLVEMNSKDGKGEKA